MAAGVSGRSTGEAIDDAISLAAVAGGLSPDPTVSKVTTVVGAINDGLALRRTVTGSGRTIGAYLGQEADGGKPHRTVAEWRAQGNHRSVSEWFAGKPSRNKS